MTAYENTVSLKSGEDREKPEELKRTYERKEPEGRQREARRPLRKRH